MLFYYVHGTHPDLEEWSAAIEPCFDVDSDDFRNLGFVDIYVGF